MAWGMGVQLNPKQVQRKSFNRILSSAILHHQFIHNHLINPVCHHNIKRNRRSVDRKMVYLRGLCQRQTSLADQRRQLASGSRRRLLGRRRVVERRSALVFRRRIERKGSGRGGGRREDPATDRRQIELPNRIRGRGSADLCQKPLAWADPTRRIRISSAPREPRVCSSRAFFPPFLGVCFFVFAD